MDAQYQMPKQLLNALIADRQSMASSDALRSLVFILLTAGLIFYFLTSKDKKKATSIAGIGILALMIFDLWGVDKRYLDDTSFAKQKLVESYQKTAADESILKDNSLSYRVLNLSVSTFNDTNTSYFHKSIGGYHAAKLRRYQELIDHRISKEMNVIRSAFKTAQTVDDFQAVFLKTPTLNMLNTKYVIYDPGQQPLINAYANGNAWFVDTVQFVPDTDREIEALNRIDPLVTAVVDEKFAAKVSLPSQINRENASIHLVGSKPDILTYETDTPSDQIAVFSEIFYDHGWKAFVDGKQTDHFRADWTLRAMHIPAGKHTVEFRFEPDTYRTLTWIGSISSLIVLLGFIGILIYTFLKKND